MKKISIAQFVTFLTLCMTLPAGISLAKDQGPSVALAKIDPTAASTVKGLVAFTESDNKLTVTYHLSGLKAGAHGFHIHEFGDCSADDASSAGAHFSPDAHQHGSPQAEMHHAGDLGNITADASGVAKGHITIDGISFKGKTGILGRAVIVHEDADDLKSQPAGNAGKRLGCGAIGIAKEMPHSLQ